MRREPYKILVAEDDIVVRRVMSRLLTNQGYQPILCSNGSEACNYLEEHHKEVALIFSDNRMPEGDGMTVLLKRGSLDDTIPFYVVSGHTTPEDVDLMAKLQFNGYIGKPDIEEQMIDVLSQTLVERINPYLEPIVFKIGGSADDYDKETDSTALKQTLDYFVEIQSKNEYQVVLTVGAGKAGDIQKTLMRKYGDTCKDVANNHPSLIDACLQLNALNIQHVMGKENSVLVTPATFLKPELNVRHMINSGKVVIMTAAPRHLAIGHADVVDKDSHSYPNIPREDSDAQTVLIAELFGADTLGLIKRTDNVYRFDPLNGFEIDETKWRLNQQQNRPLNRVSCNDLLRGRTYSGEHLSRDGAWDGEGGHLFEDSALRLFNKSRSLKKICISHIAPLEMYPNGTHIVTGDVIDTVDEQEIRKKSIDEIILGTEHACITR